MCSTVLQMVPPAPPLRGCPAAPHSGLHSACAVIPPPPWRYSVGQTSARHGGCRGWTKDRDFPGFVTCNCNLAGKGSEIKRRGAIAPRRVVQPSLCHMLRYMVRPAGQNGGSSPCWPLRWSMTTMPPSIRRAIYSTERSSTLPCAKPLRWAFSRCPRSCRRWVP